ncbi:MAG: SDR family oxidoreductase [Thermoplasmata archaeon]
MVGSHERVVMVAGVGTGLGTAIVSLLGKSGVATAGMARGRKALDTLAAACADQQRAFEPIEGDLRKREDVERAVRTTLARFHHIDGVVISAGHWIQGDALLHKISDEAWKSGLVDNLDPVFLLVRAAVPHFMERRAGSFVLVSAATPVRYAGVASYCVAKGGLLDLTFKLAKDYRPYGIRVNAVLPGNMARDLDPSHIPPSEGPIRLTTDTATSPWEVARAVVHLLSDECRWVTGAALTVDGGQSTGGDEPTS